uniref:VWFD domain-containing protein n=1 Tax=Calidris pygmaea TaxID=425635 RepID=A0A8C3PP65_9CHAR
MLGHHYYVVTPEDHKKEGLKELAVVAGDTATTVTIKAKGKFYYRGKNYPSGATIKVTLESYHAFQLQSGSDLSGTEVKANRPVAVFSGHTCIKVHRGCDHGQPMTGLTFGCPSMSSPWLVSPLVAHPWIEGGCFSPFSAASPPLSCEDLSCQEKCQVVDGQPTCVHEAPLTCWATGDSHYRTFDGKAFHLMGTCTYTLTKTCHQDPTIPFFSVEAKNEARGHLGVSYVDAVTVHVYDVTVEATRAENGIVRVNNRRSHLPISLAQGKLRLRQKGRSLLIQTHFHLKILYDWDHHLLVKLPGALSAKVCGLCGNGDPRDDHLAQGNLTGDPGWEATNRSQPCWDNCSGGDCGGCPGDEGKKYEGEESCGLMAQRPGPFEGCHHTLDPQVYLKNCVYDLCVNDGLHVLLCRALEAYADDCREEGTAVSDWRTLVNCPLSCPKNSNYTTCGPACPTTCNPTAVPTDCPTLACVETCSCQEGFVLEANRCIPQDQCGCLHEGLLHGLHEEFWGDTTCTKRCVCNGTSQNAVCREDNCQDGEECRVEEGIRGCYPKSHGTCSAVGATHYETFDGGRFVFQGTCIYQMVGLCEKTPGLVDFQVLVQNGRQDEEPPASIALVVVKVYGKTISINRKHPGKITVNGRLANLPYGRRGGKVSVSRGAGGDAVVETDFGLAVSYDGRSRLVATVPTTYAGALCGLCGNYNGQEEDEMMTKSGQVTSDPTALGGSWKVTAIPGCGEASTLECPTTTMEALRQQEISSKGCGIIREEGGPFGACHALVDPQKYFQSCLHDLCLFPEREGVRCPLIARYAEVCQAAGIAVGRWRTEDFCRFPCPPNSHYEPCSRGCGQSCRSLFSPEKCRERCQEGCACDGGLVLSGDTCVPLSRCGCHQGDFYYQAEETFLATKEEMCRCRAGGALECQEASCPEGGEGKVIEGVFQCSSATLGTCLATGDRSYVSFDGVAFNFSGTCSYVLSKTCGGGEGGQPFAVKMEKEARQKKKVSASSLWPPWGSLEVLPSSQVDSVSHHLPVTLSQGRVWVHQHGMDVLLQTDFGLVIRYDLLHHVTVTVPQSYQGHLCGLCGNYNGQQDDDFLLPGGQLAPDAVAFGSAWKTSKAPCSDDCSQDDCPVCSEEKKAVLQKSNYCGLLTVPEGPFGSCHHLIDPTLYFQTCLHDVCLAKGDTQVLCQSIQSYATTCQDAGGIIGAWRRPSFCPLRCPANSIYSLCTNLCPKSCAGLVDPSKCPQTCLEGCECHQGLVFDGLGCVPQEECGCFEDGEYHKHLLWFLPWFLLHPDPCKALRCRSKERCKLKDGQTKCVPSLVATCWAWGDPHYHTLDGLDFDFQGTCTYTMAESHGNDTSLVPFKVEGKNDVRGGVKSVSYVSLAKVKVYGQEITIHRREVGKVRVNGVVTLLPVTLEEGKVRVIQSGLSAVVETDFGLRVTYDWNWHLLLDVPSSYYRHIRGLCGNFNLKPEDDGPQGSHYHPQGAWARGWKVPEEDDPFCWDYCKGDCPFCEEEEKELYGGNQFCGLIKKGYQGPFQGCHHLVPPRDFYRNCLYDVCMSKGAKQILCKVLESYAATCRKQGAVVHDWRTPSGCRKKRGGLRVGVHFCSISSIFPLFPPFFFNYFHHFPSISSIFSPFPPFSLNFPSISSIFP